MLNTKEQVTAIAKRIIERIDRLGLKGKKKDDEALALWVGALMAAEVTEEYDLAEVLNRLGVLMVVVQGYKAVKNIAERI